MSRLIVFAALAVFGAAALAVSARTLRSGVPAFDTNSRLTAGRLWVRSIQPNADSAPAYLPRVRLRDGRVRPVVYALAGNNDSNCDPSNPVKRATLYAFDAASGKSLWQRSTLGPSRCTTAGPVTGVSMQWVYAGGLDGKMHRYDAANGAETRTRGWPFAITLMADVEKMSATPTISGRYLYVTTSGFIGDAGHYQGHLVTIDLTSGHTRVFNSLCSNIHRLLGPRVGSGNYCVAEQSGLFGRGQGTVEPRTRDVYVVSGNGPWNGRTEWGDTILKLDPSGAKLLDSFTPTNQAGLASADADLGSSGPAILPDIRQGGKTYHLLIQAGKGPACASCSGAALRLLNRDNLSGRAGPGHLGGDLSDAQAPGGSEVLTAPAVWRSPDGRAWDFVANDSGVAGYRVVTEAGGRFRLDRVWLDGSGGSTPVIKEGVLYVARGGEMRALNPSTGSLLWRSTDIGDIHWQYPMVADHRLFITDQSGRLFAYSLPK